jgi:hypothetical protein
MSSELDSPNTAGSSGTEPPTFETRHPWRYGCPYGHSAWYRTADDRFYCRTCEEPFEHLRDKKTQGTAVPPGGEQG